MKYIVIALLLLVSGYVSGQFEDQKFGVISQKEIDMESYPEDPEAGAVVLFDKGKSIFFDYRGAYDIRFTRHKRIKIFDNSELDYAEVAIPFYEDGYDATEKVVSIKAVTYNFENGRVIKQELDPSTVYVERINEKWRRKKFVLPQVKAGSIIEYEYVLETPFHFNLPDWTFQHKIPTIYSGYEVRMIPFYEYVFLAQGIKEFDHKANVMWPLQHLKSASTYLKKDPDIVKATGGTNWLQYLPPRKQMINYYPELWSEEEMKDWGVSVNLTFG